MASNVAMSDLCWAWSGVLSSSSDMSARSRVCRRAGELLHRALRDRFREDDEHHGKAGEDRDHGPRRARQRKIVGKMDVGAGVDTDHQRREARDVVGIGIGSALHPCEIANEHEENCKGRDRLRTALGEACDDCNPGQCPQQCAGDASGAASDHRACFGLDDQRKNRECPIGVIEVHEKRDSERDHHRGGDLQAIGGLDRIEPGLRAQTRACRDALVQGCSRRAPMAHRRRSGDIARNARTRLRVPSLSAPTPPFPFRSIKFLVATPAPASGAGFSAPDQAIQTGGPRRMFPASAASGNILPARRFRVVRGRGGKAPAGRHAPTQGRNRSR
jgi:hypothetical protein